MDGWEGGREGGREGGMTCTYLTALQSSWCSSYACCALRARARACVRMH